MCEKSTLVEKCKLHSKNNKNFHTNFVGNILLHSESKNLQDAMREWVYDSEHHSDIKVQCFCGFKNCKNITWYRNVKNNKRITVGSQCVSHFSDKDEYLGQKTDYFTVEGYEKDGFVVDDSSEDEEEKENY